MNALSPRRLSGGLGESTAGAEADEDAIDAPLAAGSGAGTAGPALHASALAVLRNFTFSRWRAVNRTKMPLESAADMCVIDGGARVLRHPHSQTLVRCV